MSYLARLKAEFSGKRQPCELTKPTKAPSVSSVSAPSRHVCGIDADREAGNPGIVEAPSAAGNDPIATKPTPADVRIGKMAAKLASDPGLRYAVETHTDADPDAVILTVAIRGKGACELRISKSRYDAFALLELIDKHGATLH